MNIKNIASDLSFDMVLKLIRSRVQQLIQQEAAALVESRHLTSSLQRKVERSFSATNIVSWSNKVFQFSTAEVTERPTREQGAPRAAPQEKGVRARGGEKESLWGGR